MTEYPLQIGVNTIYDSIGASIEGWDAISIAACIPHDHIWIGIAGCSKGIANRPFKATVQYTTLL